MQADVLAAVSDTSSDKHFLSSFPTGYGKTYPMLLASLLSPAGEQHQDRDIIFTFLRIRHGHHSAAGDDPPAAGARGGEVGTVLCQHQQGARLLRFLHLH